MRGDSIYSLVSHLPKGMIYKFKTDHVFMEKFRWQHLNHLQIGRYAEYLIKMELVSYGFDIYTSEVDDRGIDFVIRINCDKYYDVQVKSIRNLNYIFFSKKKFKLSDNLFAAIVIFVEGKPPELYLIPSKRWESQDSLFVNREYENKKSEPEWGLNLSKKNIPLLSEYSFKKSIENLRALH